MGAARARGCLVGDRAGRFHGGRERCRIDPSCEQHRQAHQDLFAALDGRLVDQLAQRLPLVLDRGRSIGSQRALGRRTRTDADLEATVTGIVDRLGRRLRSAGRVSRTLVLRMRFDDYSRATRSRTLRDPTDRTEVLLREARGLLVAALPFDDRCTDVLDLAVDGLRDRFGSASVTRGVLLGRSPGLSVPMLPD